MTTVSLTPVQPTIQPPQPVVFDECTAIPVYTPAQIDALYALKQALDAYEPRRLIAMMLEYNGNHCALGVLNLAQIGTANQWSKAARQLSGYLGDAPAAIRVAEINNGFVGSPEERYVYMRTWVDDTLAQIEAQQRG